MSNKKVLLSDIKSLYLFADSYTKAKRTTPIPQLECNGKICSKFQPQSIECTNIGGSGTDIKWKCSADLPSSLRFGRIDVSCEGWSRSGDPYVLDGSCGLSYDLVKVHTEAFDDSRSHKQYQYRNSWKYSETFSSLAFSLVFCAVFCVVLYSLFKTCFTRQANSPSRRITGPSGGNDGPSQGGLFPGSHQDDNNNPPPPYAPNPKPDPNAPAGAAGWRPGFWTGLGLGTLAQWFMGGNRRRPDYYGGGDWRAGGPRQWDWDRPRGYGFGSGDSAFRTRFASPNEGFWSNTRSRNFDRGEGSSSMGSGMGSMRSSSGLARSNVR